MLFLEYILINLSYLILSFKIIYTLQAIYLFSSDSNPLQTNDKSNASSSFISHYICVNEFAYLISSKSSHILFSKISIDVLRDMTIAKNIHGIITN